MVNALFAPSATATAPLGVMVPPAPAAAVMVCVSAVTERRALLLVTLPAALVTTTLNCDPLSAVVRTGVV